MTRVLFVCAAAEGSTLECFDEWYDRVHLPGRMGVPGVQYAVRFRGIGEQAARTTGCLYVLSSGAVLESSAYLDLQAQTAEDTASVAATRPLRSRRTPVVRPPAPPARMGHLKIVGGDVNHARVLIVRVARGRAPTAAIELATGRHQLVLELPDGTTLGPFDVVVDERSTAVAPYVVRCTRSACR